MTDMISSYSREQAIDDGFLVDVSATAREAGFRFPVAMTRAAWAELVAWTDADARRTGAYQDEAGRLWDVLWMLLVAIRARRNANTDASRIDFTLLRVDRNRRARRASPVTPYALCGPGDTGEPVITIMLQGED